VLVHGLLLVENHSSRRNPKWQNTAKIGGSQRNEYIFDISWHSHSNHNIVSSVLFYVQCSVQVAGHFLKI